MILDKTVTTTTQRCGNTTMDKSVRSDARGGGADPPRLDVSFNLLHHEIVNHFFSPDDSATEASPPVADTPRRPRAAASLAIDSAVESAVLSKLEFVGYQVGLRVVERLSADHKRLREEVEVMRFLCREVWAHVFDKHVDSLKTDVKTYRTFEVLDKSFPPLQAILGADSCNSQYVTLAPRLLALPSGIIRGALDALGHPCFVSAKLCPIGDIDPNARGKAWVTLFEVRLQHS